MQMNGCAELAAEAAGRLPGEIGANRRDLPLQGIHDVALRIELQGRIELHMQHFESWHFHFHGAVGADLGHVLQLLGPHPDLAGDGGGAVPPLQWLGGLRLQGFIDRGEGSLHCTRWRWAAMTPRVHTGQLELCLFGASFGFYIVELREKCRGGRKERRKKLMKD